MDEANEAYEERLEERRQQRRREEEATRRDAERYRWLRDVCDCDQYTDLLFDTPTYPENRKVLLEGPALDAAIDAAMNGANA